MTSSQDFLNGVCGPGLEAEFLMHLFIRSRERFRSLSAGAVHKDRLLPHRDGAPRLRPPIPSLPLNEHG